MKEMDEERLVPSTSTGLGVMVAAILLAGEMAGMGMLKLPSTLVDTGWYGLLLIVFFAANAAYIGTRLGLSWIMLEERHPEFRGHVRDPYPAIAEAATGKIGRHIASGSMIFTLYGVATVDLVLTAQFLSDLFPHLDLSLCLWMVIVAAAMTPITWLGTPKDFWWITVGALLTTIAAALIIISKNILDTSSTSSCYSNSTNGTTIHPNYPAPNTMGFVQAFGSIMFSFGGAATFPTIQADMKDRARFPISAMLAMTILLLIYFSVSATGYFTLGDAVKSNIVLSLCTGPALTIVSILLLIHLVTAFPLIINVPNQFLEEVFGLPSSFHWKRVLYRSSAMAVLLFIAESIPNFGSILGLVGGSTVTLLSFVCPPLFYMRLVDSATDQEIKRAMPMYERAYCWILIAVGLIGGAASTYFAVKDIIETPLSNPCYISNK